MEDDTSEEASADQSQEKTITEKTEEPPEAELKENLKDEVSEFLLDHFAVEFSLWLLLAMFHYLGVGLILTTSKDNLKY